jgi:Calx-beta domain/Cysteine-rich secretory protein family
MHRPVSWRRIVSVLAVTAAAGSLLCASATTAGAVTDPVGALSANAGWLTTLNAWRAASNLDPVTEDPTWSAGDFAHSRYIVESGDFGHDENLGGPFHTVDGETAGQNGNVAASSDPTRTDRRFIEQWITAPFHAAGMLDPLLATTGFGSYRRIGAQPWPAAATLDVIRGRTAPPQTAAVTFPGDGAVLPVPQQTYRGGESPDPLAPCAGYDASAGTGTPLFALLPQAPTGPLTATVTRDGVDVASCAYDETSYTNPDATSQQLARDVLGSRHQVVVVPRQPLTQGSSYGVSLSTTYAGDTAPTVTSWSFTAASQPDVSIGSASIVEGQTRTRYVRVTVSLSRTTTTPVTVNYATASGTATAGSDFSGKSGTVTIAAGATTAVITVAVKGDRLVEGNETFTVNLSDPQGATLRHATGSVSILDDDRITTQSGGVQVSIGSASLVEGNSGTRALRFTVSLSGVSQRVVQVHYATAPGTATATDFTGRAGNVSIPAGATSALVSVWVKGDTEHEANEKFTVQLSAPVNAAFDRPTGTGTILNDD